MHWFFIGAGVGAAAGIAFLIFNKRKSRKFTLDTVVGENCTVIERVDNYAGSGLVKVGNQIWAARGVADDSVYEAGEVLSVVAIEGVKLICKK